MRIRVHGSLCLVCVCISSVVGVAEETTEDPRLSHLLELADRFEITVEPEEGELVVAERLTRPLLRYTNPLYEAQSDGALVMWNAGGLPVALASLSIRHDKVVFLEMVSLAESKMVCRVGERITWSPTRSGFARQDFPGVPAPRENQRLRLSQMKRLAERFSAPELRLLPTPLYRYGTESDDVIDGALFGLVKANDPEIVVIIEAHQDGDGKRWKYALARMRAPPLKIRLDDVEVWSIQGYWRNPRANTDPYIERQHSELPIELRQAEVGTQ